MLTKRQKDVLDFIRFRRRVYGMSPTVREIGEQFSITSPNGVMCHIRALEKKGMIQRAPYLSRSIVPTVDLWQEDPANVGALAASLCESMTGAQVHDIYQHPERYQDAWREFQRSIQCQVECDDGA